MIEPVPEGQDTSFPKAFNADKTTEDGRKPTLKITSWNINGIRAWNEVSIVLTWIIQGLSGPNLGYFCGQITATSPHKIWAKIPLFDKKNSPKIFKNCFFKFFIICSPYIYICFHLYARYIIDF